MIWDKGVLCQFYTNKHMYRKYGDLWSCFFAKIHFTDDLDMERGCWEWTGALNPEGYGKLRMLGVDWLSHRLSYTHHKGAIPPDKLCSAHVS